MATYKVIQDIEAEDKFLGPLTLKQFIFAAVGAIFGYLTIVIVTKVWFAAIVFAPVSLFGFFMAIPWSKDQPTDVWVLAKLRFWFKPRVRTWDQSGVQELVTITAPKKVEKVLTKNLEEKEVKSRLKALADTMNTRGWTIKHSSYPNLLPNNGAGDRLVDTLAEIGSVPVQDETTSDILNGNQQINNLINASQLSYKQGLLQKIDVARTSPENTGYAQAVEPNAGNDSSEDQITKKLLASKEAKELSTNRMQRLSSKKEPATQNKASNQSNKTKTEKAISTVTQEVSPDIIDLAHNNDFNVATLARQAKKDKVDSQEVVVSLH